MSTYSSSFAFTNNTESTHEIAPINIGALTNYAKIEDEADRVKLSNLTSPLSQPEILVYRGRPTTRKNMAPLVKTQNPPKTEDAVEYTVRLDELLRTTLDGEIVEDDTIKMSITVSHDVSDFITPAHIEQCFKRLAGATRYSDGTPKWADLMRSALAPSRD